MERKLIPSALCVSLLAVCALAARAEEPSDVLPGIAESTAGLERRDGFLTHWLDPEAGKVWLLVPPPRGERGEVLDLLYVEGLRAGLGSNPVGLDRGQLGDTRYLVVRRVADRVVLEEPNLGFRALSEDADERRAVRESFASSVLWAGPVAARDADGTTLVDLTSFLVRDAHGVAATLERTEQGTFALDAGRSMVDFAQCLSFPDNVELEALLTFTGAKPGSEVRAVAPTPTDFTLVQHHSFVRPPAPGYRTREFDPRAGSFAVQFHDYASGLDEPLQRRWIVRHRLEPRGKPRPNRPVRVREPIVYYVDRAAPEPVRGALVDGASWWASAFDAAGFRDAFKVELLPEGAHPLDVRYNVIQWVHRATRGWSYGGGVVDPRTGEMIKGHVSLGSLRVRQDRRIFEGLLGSAGTGSGARDDPLELALARIRQLSAHEVGHTLGLTHNFIASTYGGRASVMDYPAPLLELGKDGSIDPSNAYAVGVGAWDRHAIEWAYRVFPQEADEAAALEAIVQRGIERGWRFITDHDARPAGAAHPLANLWDNGSDPVAELHRLLDVRAVALASFGERNVAAGQPLARLEETLAPVYFLHRYQVDAVVKTLGGLEYDYTLAGEGRPGSTRLPFDRQQRALEALMRVLTPEALDLPEAVLQAIAPRPFGHPPNRETFAGTAAPAFDPLQAARAAADAVLAGVLQPQRCRRMIDHHRRDGAQPSFDQVLQRLWRQGFEPAPGERHAALQRVIRGAIVDAMIRLAADPAAGEAVRADVEHRLGVAAGFLGAAAGDDAEIRHRRYLAGKIRRFLSRGATEPVAAPAPAPMPPGSPIGVHGCSRGGGD